MIYTNVLTGGIGCGKSVVSRYLMLEGFSIIDADKIAHALLDKNANVIASNFGSDIIYNGMVDRKKLGAIVFRDRQKKILLESILHPLIYSEITNQSEVLETKKKPFFVEIPLYFESKFTYKNRFVICVYAPKDIQIQRIMQRDKLDTNQANQRIDSQIDIEIKKNKSDFVIDNSKDLKSLEKNINEFLLIFRNEYNV